MRFSIVLRDVVIALRDLESYLGESDREGWMKNNIIKSFFSYFFLDKKVTKNQDKNKLLPALAV